MRASKDTYKKVAECCSEYSPVVKEAVTNSTNDDCCVSCETCKHFDAAEYCKLDIYDKIVKEHHLCCK